MPNTSAVKNAKVRTMPAIPAKKKKTKVTTKPSDESPKAPVDELLQDENTPEEIAELTGASEKLTRKRLERIMEIFADYWGWT